MASLVLFLMILSGIIFIGAVLLMTPKGGIGFGIGGMATSNEYGSKKSVEFTLKRAAIVSIVIFTACALVYPYMAKKSLSTGKAVPQVQTQQTPIKLTPENVKVETKTSDTKVETTNKPVEIKVQSNTSENK